MSAGVGIKPPGLWEACRPESGGTCQYRPAYALRAAASTRYTVPSAGTQAPAQHQNANGSRNRNVTITAYVVPIPPPELTDFPPLTVPRKHVTGNTWAPHENR